MRGALRVTVIALGLLTAAGCADRGRELFVSSGCASCHRFRGAGGGLGPDLGDIASRRNAAWIRQKIRTPAAGTPGSRMPAFDHLSWFDLQSLVAFLRS